jgi:hypothetical protein
MSELGVAVGVHEHGIRDQDYVVAARTERDRACRCIAAVGQVSIDRSDRRIGSRKDAQDSRKTRVDPAVDCMAVHRCSEIQADFNPGDVFAQGDQVRIGFVRLL